MIRCVYYEFLSSEFLSFPSGTSTYSGGRVFCPFITLKIYFPKDLQYLS
nr:MAG TPA: hypothetical protein [Bacteriophage sp.]